MFSSEFNLSDLLNLNGGDGTEGFVLKGIDAYDNSGISGTFSISLGKLRERNEEGQTSPKREDEEISPDFPEGEITGKILS